MIKRYIYAIALLATVGTYAQQLQNANWFFGKFSGLSFIPDPQNPTTINTSLLSWEGCASYSNTNGQLLFYTNGVSIYDKNNVLLTNGDNLNGDISATQGIQLIKAPMNNSARVITNETVYVVTISGETGGKKGLYYSEVDINSTTGVGEVIAATKNTPLRDHNNIPIEINYATTGNKSEKLTSAPHCDGVNYWLITQIGSNIYSYLATSAGISLTPTMVSPAPLEIQNILGTSVGQMKISPNNDRIAICYSRSYNNPTNSGELALGNFDSTTGAVTFDSATINPGAYQTMYGVEFSPDSQLIYFGLGQDKIYQGNAYSATTNNIIEITDLDGHDKTIHYRMGLQRAINGKIYISTGTAQATPNGPEFFLSVINDPNNITNPNLQDNCMPSLYGKVWYSFPGWVHSQVNKCPSSYVLVDPDTHTVPHIYQTKNIIVTKNNYKVDSGKNITLKAGSYIEMSPNTSIVSGSVFLAEIVTCMSCTFSEVITEQSVNRNIETITPVKLVLYPNPASEYVNLDVPNHVLKQVTVISLDGTTMFNGAINANFKLDVSNYKKDIYFVTVITESGEIFTEKIMVN